MRILFVVVVLGLLACAGGMVWQWQRAERLDADVAQKASAHQVVEKALSQDAEKAKKEATDAEDKLKVAQVELEKARKDGEKALDAAADAKKQKDLAEKNANEKASALAEVKKEKEKIVAEIEGTLKAKTDLANKSAKDAADAKKALADLEVAKKKSDDLLKKAQDDLQKTQTELKKAQEELKKGKGPSGTGGTGKVTHTEATFVGRGSPKRRLQAARGLALWPQGATERRGRTT